MRSLKALYTIPAHLSNVSDVRFFRANDKFFVEPPTATTQDADVEMKDGSPQSQAVGKVPPPLPPRKRQAADSVMMFGMCC